jgi:selenide,water dikinase
VLRGDAPVLKDIVLVGGGHSHVGVLRRFAMRPEPGVRLTLICTDPHTPYSGMLPGYIAGHYTYDEVHIDLSRLAQWAGARFIHAEVTGLDRVRRQVLLRDRPPLAYDLVSINTGATPQTHRVPGAAQSVVSVKPINQFNQRWLALLERVRTHPGRTTLAVVGAGAGGVELTLAMQWRLRAELRALGRDADELEFHLFSADALILPTHHARVRRHFDDVLAARGVQVHRGAPVAEVAPGRLRAKNGEWLEADEIVWVTRAGGAPWLQGTGLALDGDGFLCVGATLQSTSDERVFAAGDVASLQGRPLEKAGVFAVRMGRPLADNLRAAARGEALRAWKPQRRWLALISTGDRHAVASRGALGFAGDWVWRWKDWIDRRFMRRFSEFPAMPTPGPADPSAGPTLKLDTADAQQALSALAMRCGGCGAKVGADVLARTMARLQPRTHADVLLGLDAPDDAAIVRVPPGKALVQTVDFFRAFIDDPYVFGQIAANHALGDLYAMGAQPHTALAIATVPPGLDRKLEDLLLQMMQGALSVLDLAGCALVGGHTAEGRDLALGFALNGLVPESLAGVTRKAGLRAGDALVLTQPLGTGTLFVAHAAHAARGRWIAAAVQHMTQPARAAAEVLRAHGAAACTDVTGFGLVGHLLEMTRASGVDAELSLAALPLLDGSLECAAAGHLSSLHPANLRLRAAVQDAADHAKDARWPLLFDPQTAGGVLAGVPTDRAHDCVAALRAAGYARAAVIGYVQAASNLSGAPIALKA